MEATLSAIGAKTLLLAGDEDRVVPSPLTFAMAAEIASCRTLLLEGVGHATCLQAPAEVARALTCFIDDKLPRQGVDTP
jgi:pimeloyl-ACP methyl ester carboxylesterase